MLATSEDGDAFVWGCGLTHQLGNRPRDVQNPSDREEDPEDELRPYKVSSKQLETRFVMLADGGAQHSVELAWDKSYSKLQADDTGTGPLPEGQGNDVEATEPPAKRRLTEAASARRAAVGALDFGTEFRG